MTGWLSVVLLFMLVLDEGGRLSVPVSEWRLGFQTVVSFVQIIGALLILFARDNCLQAKKYNILILN